MMVLRPQLFESNQGGCGCCPNCSFIHFTILFHFISISPQQDSRPIPNLSRSRMLKQWTEANGNKTTDRSTKPVSQVIARFAHVGRHNQRITFGLVAYPANTNVTPIDYVYRMLRFGSSSVLLTFLPWPCCGVVYHPHKVLITWLSFHETPSISIFYTSILRPIFLLQGRCFGNCALFCMCWGAIFKVKVSYTFEQGSDQKQCVVNMTSLQEGRGKELDMSHPNPFEVFSEGFNQPTVCLKKGGGDKVAVSCILLNSQVSELT